MTTTGERLVTLSELPGVETAMVHFLAITTGGGGPGGTVLVDMADVEFERTGDLELAAGGELTVEGSDDLDSDSGGDLNLTDDADLEVGCE